MDCAYNRYDSVHAKRISAQLFEEKITATFPSVFTRRSRGTGIVAPLQFLIRPRIHAIRAPWIVSLVAGRQVPRCIPQHCFSNESRGNLERSSALPPLFLFLFTTTVPSSSSSSSFFSVIDVPPFSDPLYHGFNNGQFIR